MATKSTKTRKSAAKPQKARAGKTAAKPAGAARDAWGFRQGSKASRAATLYAAKGGATRAEIVKACGSPQMNLLTALEEHGRKVKTSRRACKVTGREVTAYHIA